MGRGGERLDGGGRFRVTHAVGADVVVKRGPAGPLAREARALRLLTGRGPAPDLVATGPGTLTTTWIDGAPRAAEELTDDHAAALGQTLRVAHDTRRTASGGLPQWRSRARSLAGYQRGRCADALRAAGPDRALAERVVAALATLPPAARTGEPEPFRMLHGDLVLSNIVWAPQPRLVDWEFWRMGDPAEDLAYLQVVNDLPDALAAAVVRGYGETGMRPRVEGWRALCALDAGLWYRDAGQGARADALLTRAAALAAPSAAAPASAPRRAV